MGDLRLSAGFPGWEAFCTSAILPDQYIPILHPGGRMPKRRPGKTEASYEMSVLLPGESLFVSGSSANDRAVEFSVCSGQGKSETAG